MELMNKRTLGVTLVVALVASLFLVAGLYAGTKMQDEIQMNAPYKHKKGIVTFTHKKHVTDYKLGCGECHHDDKGKPLNNLKEGDNVQPCIECHKKPGELKGKKAEGLSDKEKLAYEANAVHENCLGCHKKFNSKAKKGAEKAPTKCKDCHPGT
jgi:hypothetical protein